MQSTQDAIARSASTAGIAVHFVRYMPMSGWVTFYWNTLATLAFDGGADYFYQLNDDVEFVSPDLAAPLIRALERTDGRGVAGPSDLHDMAYLTMTQSFVGRRHYESFGYIFPWEFRNSFCDDWMTHVYEVGLTHWGLGAMVRNTNVGGTRYDVCVDSGALRATLFDALARGFPVSSATALADDREEVR